MRRGPAAFVSGAAIVLLLGSACRSGTSSQGQTGGTGKVRVGALAPDFSLPAAHGGTISLAGFQGRKPVLLYFSMGPG